MPIDGEVEVATTVHPLIGMLVPLGSEGKVSRADLGDDAVRSPHESKWKGQGRANRDTHEMPPMCSRDGLNLARKPPQGLMIIQACNRHHDLIVSVPLHLGWQNMRWF